MGAPDVDEATADQLREVAASDNLSLLLGAGASMAAGLPAWDVLAVRLLINSGVVEDEETARAFLAPQDPMLAVEAARANLTDAERLSLLRTSLYEDDLAPAPSAMHLAVASLAASRPLGSIRLFTLNFDLLLEEAVRMALDELGCQTGVFRRSTELPRASADQQEVHHLHGFVSAQEDDAGGESVILGLSDFAGMPQRAWQLAELQHALQHGPLVLAGTSYWDPDIRNWVFELTRQNEMNPVLVLVARASMGLSQDQFDRVGTALVAQWRRVGVQPILLNDHADAAQAIRELQYVGQSGYIAPRTRASRLVEHCFVEFDRLQAEHSDFLEQDLRSLRDQLGPEATVTLWLANGERGLVRWASPDRIYRKHEELRVVPVGFDSPWVAAQCIAVDEVVARGPAEDPDGTRRWRSVVAAPVSVGMPGGPPMTSAVLSSATPDRLDEQTSMAGKGP